MILTVSLNAEWSAFLARYAGPLFGAAGLVASTMDGAFRAALPAPVEES